MANIFETLRSYANQYSVDDRREFSPAEVALVSSAKVVLSQYGQSVCFFMKDGGQKYIPVSRDSVASEGDVVDISKAHVLTLSKDGQDRITRIEL